MGVIGGLLRPLTEVARFKVEKESSVTSRGNNTGIQMKSSLRVSGRTCFLGKHRITLLNVGLDQLTSACSTLLNLAWLLKGYTSWQAARLGLAERPSPRCSPLATLLDGINLIRGSLWPKLLTGSTKAAGITWGRVGKKVNYRRNGKGGDRW